MNLSRKDIEEKIKNQIALEFYCSPADFDKTENLITVARLHEKRRKFSDKPFFLQMATFGKSTVISADESIHPWLNEWIKGKQGIWLFEQHNYFELECELRKHGYKMAPTHHMFMPSPELIEIKTDFNIKWLEQKDIASFYGNENFPNAICDSLNQSVLMCFALLPWMATKLWAWPAALQTLQNYGRLELMCCLNIGAGALQKLL